MMKKSFAIATFVGVAGVGGVGVHALSNISLHGSDTLFQFTTAVLQPAVCPGAVGLTYLGGGSGTGETGLTNGSQSVAPMSRFLAGSSGVCTAAAADGFQAQGVVVALDGVALVTSSNAGGSAACNGPAGTNATCATPPNDSFGLIGTNSNETFTVAAGQVYTFSNWKDVLKILYGGVINSGFTFANGGGCGGTVRTALANSYPAVFETSCTTGGCTQIRHIFRRDDSSGTSDVFSQLVGLASPNNSSNSVGGLFFLGTDAFCNDFHQATTAAALQALLPIAPGGTVSYENVIPNDYQDNDPIRRPCAGTGVAGANATRGNENVCEPDGALASGKVAGTLGFLLTMADTNQAGANQYGDATSPVCSGPFVLVQAPLVPVGKGSSSATCPNGDDNTGGNCYVPSKDPTSLNPNCVADANSNGAPVVNAAPANGLNPANADGRVYNKWVYSVGSGIPTVATDNTNATAAGTSQRPIFGAYYRIHQTLSMNNPNTSPTCLKSDMTDQIGCLVTASPCSIGYAGRSADQQAGATALLVKGIPDSLTCVQNFGYPLSRKLYLDTLLGYTATGVAGQELALAACESGGAVGGINAVVSAIGFVPLPDAGPNSMIGPDGGVYNNGKPFAEDFNEQMLCDAGIANTFAPANNTATGLPTIGTTCGNAQKEAFEDCDNGTAGTANAIGGGNGSPGNSCTITCRNVN